MIAKIAVVLCVVACASAGVVSVSQSVAHSPASTVKLANVVSPVVTYAAAPQVIAGQGLTYAAGPIAYSAPSVVAAPVAAPITYAVPAPVAYQTAAKVIQTVEPVEQHGYQIAY